MSRFSTPDEGFAWIESLTNLEGAGRMPEQQTEFATRAGRMPEQQTEFATRAGRMPDTREYRLDRMQRLFEHWNNPHLKLPSIHAAGSKGKGSTLSYVASGLAALGHRPGLYRSPHVVDYRERISIAQAFLPDAVYLARLNEIHEKIAGGAVLAADDSPTSFEMLTLLAFLCFLDAGCDIVVVETGLGGRLDATNLVQPLLSIITSIEVEHTEFLGDKIEAIAAEKAGIIKPAVPVFAFPQRRIVRRVLEKRAAELGSPLHWPLGKSKFGGNFGSRMNLLALPGKLALSGTLASKCIEFLLEKGDLPLPAQDSYKKTISTAITATQIQGRMQMLPDSLQPGLCWLLDGAHTRESLRGVVDALRDKGRQGSRYFVRKKVPVLFGLSAGRDAVPLLRILKRVASQLIITSAGTFKPGSLPQHYAAAKRIFGARAELQPNATQAVQRVRSLTIQDAGPSSKRSLRPGQDAGPSSKRSSKRGSPAACNRVVLVVGSFYLLGSILPVLEGKNAASGS